MVKGDGIEINRHTHVCPMIWSKITFPEKTVICEVLTENIIYDPAELLSYQDKIKKSDKQVLLSFNGKIPSWWNTKTNKRHYTSLCLVCNITFVALDYNLHQCVLRKQVAEIDVDKPARVKRADVPELKEKYYVSAESIKDLPDAPRRRKKTTDEGFVQTTYTNHSFLKRKIEANNGNSSKKVKRNSTRNENAFDDPALESANV